jgi:inner membrane protein
MASLPTHAVAALALGTAFAPVRAPKRFWIWGAALAMLPDADVIGLAFGVPYGSPLGHRGFTHSILAAALFAVLVLVWERRRDPDLPVSRWGSFFLIAALSHGVLDAMTTGGKGVGFFIPFDTTRYFLPWRPIRVSPIGVGPFLSSRGVSVLANEALWVWIPSALFAGCVVAVRGFFKRDHAEGS